MHGEDSKSLGLAVDKHIQPCQDNNYTPDPFVCPKCNCNTFTIVDTGFEYAVTCSSCSRPYDF